MVSSSRPCASCTTASGLPAPGRSAKTSSWRKGRGRGGGGMGGGGRKGGRGEAGGGGGGGERWVVGGRRVQRGSACRVAAARACVACRRARGWAAPGRSGKRAGWG